MTWAGSGTKKRYLMCVAGRSEKLEEVLWASGKKAAYAAWLRRHSVIDFIEDQEGYVQITAERLLTEQEVEAREAKTNVAGEKREPIE
jgi:hypothetical protein